MSSLIGDLNSAARALAAHQAGVEVAGRNLANVNTPGYARQRVILGDVAILDDKLGPIGNGVEARGIEQIRDQFLDAAVTREVSGTALLKAQQDALQRAEANLGERIDRSNDAATVDTTSQAARGVSAALNDFFNAFDEVAANPTDVGTKQVLLQKTDILAEKLNVTDTRLADLQGDLTSGVTAGVTTVNSLLTQIGDLNGEIQKFEIERPLSANDLRDQRQSRLEELAKYIDIRAQDIPNGNGQVQVIAKDSTGADVILVDKTTVRGGISFDGTNISGGAPSVQLGLQGGSLKGMLLARDGAVQDIRDDLKKTADQLAAAVNAAYAPTGGTIFQVPPATGLLARDPALTASTLKSTATTDAGANEVALAVANVGRTKFSTGAGDVIDGSIGSFFNKMVTGFGEKLSGIEARLGDQELVEKMTTTQRDAVSSVSMDEEMTDLMKFQRAYQASSRVVRVVDEMLDTLINNTR